MISQKQLQVLAFGESRYDALICDGAIRSGKTAFMSVGFVLWAMKYFTGRNFAICGKTVGTAMKNIVVPLMDLSYMRRRYDMKLSRAENKLTVSRGGRTNTFYIYGGKDESSYMLIQGITLAGVMLDETALMTRSFVEQALARCSVEGSKFWFNCNPAGPKHWFYEEWVCKAEEKNALHLHFEMRDNPSLSEEMLRRYESLYTGVFYQRYILGLWVNAEGTIYREFAGAVTSAQNRFLWPPDQKLKPWRVNIGVDFGGHLSKHSFVAVGVLPGWSGCVGLMSCRVEPYGEDADHLAVQFLRFAQAVFSRYGRIDAVYADSAEQTLIRHLISRAQASELPWLAVRIGNSAKIEINDRIRLTSILMAAGRFWYMPEAQTLRDALAAALWDSRSPAQDRRLDDGTTDIDTLDAFEYAIERDYKRYLKSSEVNG
ncbi:MAG: PBSX family phage terminase large subunit [Oscillospiraceae bacterium]|nr:PBSX family phage terminase large subunit [Oscillospiraceae bacterium]